MNSEQEARVENEEHNEAEMKNEFNLGFRGSKLAAEASPTV